MAFLKKKYVVTVACNVGECSAMKYQVLTLGEEMCWRHAVAVRWHEGIHIAVSSSHDYLPVVDGQLAHMSTVT
jgi:hypothetical protein